MTSQPQRTFKAQRPYAEPRRATPDEAGWRFVAEPQSAVRRLPSLSWRLRH
jgi:hypothetical protein